MDAPTPNILLFFFLKNLELGTQVTAHVQEVGFN
jgi:hypothetical protein